MGQPWRDERSWSLVDQLSEDTGRDLADLLTGADAETLKATHNAQIATFTLSLVVLDAVRRAGLDTGPAAVAGVAGQSVGEYTALVAAGVLTAGDGARLVCERGEAMQEAADSRPGTMAAVLGLDAEHVAEACAGVEGAWVSNDNAPGQIVIAGTAAGVDAAGDGAKLLGAKKVLALPVGGAFHSPLMAPAQARLDAVLAATSFAVPEVPVVSNVDGQDHRDADGWRKRLSAQLCQPVRWRESLLRLHALGALTFLELGPGTELSGMVKRTLMGAGRANVAAPDDLPAVAHLLAGGLTG